jgi:uncharacterized protein YecE (DUF72 family)
VAQLWAERTPASFLFNVKAFRLLTGHQTAPAALPKDIAKALGPIKTRNLYYKDAPAEIRDAVWGRFRELSSPPCCFGCVDVLSAEASGLASRVAHRA